MKNNISYNLHSIRKRDVKITKKKFQRVEKQNIVIKMWINIKRDRELIENQCPGCEMLRKKKNINNY